MLGNRRNLVFRVSIVINIAVILYAAVQLSSTNGPGMEWVPVSADGSERADYRYASRDDFRNETQPAQQELSPRNTEESTSQKTTSTTQTTNKTAPSTVPVTEKKSVSAVEAETTNDTLQEITDEDALADVTLTRLKQLLACNDKDFFPRMYQRGEYWVLENYVRADHGNVNCHESITYTTHAGFEFLDNVQPLVERWMAPISIAIHAPGSDLLRTVNSIRYLRECLGNALVQQFVTFHLFFSHKHIPAKIPDPEQFIYTPYNCSLHAPFEFENSTATYMKEKNLLYPVNVARNIARDAALTHFILPSDIELYPSPSLVPRFLNMIARNGAPLNSSSNPRVFPISIFEVDAKVKPPTTKTELRQMLAKKTAIPFHKFVCPNCHNIPHGQQWMTAAEARQMEVFHVGKRIGKFEHWEPIFIGTNQEPYYDERLSWEGKKDKMTQGYILCVRDYDFMILNNAFLCHKPGIKRFHKDPKRDAITGRQNAFVKKVIMPELKKLYGIRKGCNL